MERFIENFLELDDDGKENLKSSMERFIARKASIVEFTDITFKIQYGEIYSPICVNEQFRTYVFKIQYGEIYSVFSNCT